MQNDLSVNQGDEMARMISATEAKAKLSALMDWAVKNKDEVIVQSRGAPKVAIISYDAYEQFKELTRGEKVTVETLRTFVEGLDLPAEAKARLLTLEPATYTGIAATLARKMNDPD